MNLRLSWKSIRKLRFRYSTGKTPNFVRSLVFFVESYWLRGVVSVHDATEIGLRSVVSVYDTMHLDLRSVVSMYDATHLDLRYVAGVHDATQCGLRSVVSVHDATHSDLRGVAGMHDATHSDLRSVVSVRDATHSDLRYVAHEHDTPQIPKILLRLYFPRGFLVSFYKITGQPSLSQSPAIEVEQRLRLPYRPYDFPLGLGQYTHQAGLAIFPQIRAQ